MPELHVPATNLLNLSVSFATIPPSRGSNLQSLEFECELHNNSPSHVSCKSKTNKHAISINTGSIAVVTCSSTDNVSSSSRRDTIAFDNSNRTVGTLPSHYDAGNNISSTDNQL